DAKSSGTTDDVIYTANAGADTVTKITSAGVVSVFAATGVGPSGIAIDSTGNVYTANTTASTVTKITSAGSPSLFAATGAGPTAIAIDGSDSIYTANASANTITKITSAGVVSTPTSTGGGPAAIVVGATGIVYAANQRASTVTRIPTTGTPTPAWAVIAERGAACTGTVIAPAVVLTAAHCTMDQLRIAPIAGIARPGVIDALDGSTERDWDMADLLPHPGYDPNTYRNDVALVVLESSTGTPAMPLIAPWQDGLVVGGAPAGIAGWGLTVDGGSSPRYLQEASVPVISDADCVRDMPAEFRPILDPVSMLCAGDLPAGIDTCQGDSGGPLTLTIAGTRTMIGDTSWGPNPCASGPGVYGRMSAFRSWILDDLSTASALVRSHLQEQNAAARNLELRSTGPDVTLTWGVTPANWTTTGFRVTINGSVETVTGPSASRTVRVPAGGTVMATVEPRVTLGTTTMAAINATPIPTRAPVVSATSPARPRVGARLT
ncbi:MAG: trypsin-like serine protease, partial [Actinomycetota bacterium]